mgnify:CR=1 FL=1
MISCTREALSKLGDWCSSTAKALGFTLLISTGVNNALAQSIPEARLDNGPSVVSNTARISVSIMLSMLTSANAPKTVEAMEFLAGLTPEQREGIM